MRAAGGGQRRAGAHGGVAARCARGLRYREDKTVDEVDTIDDVLALGS